MPRARERPPPGTPSPHRIRSTPACISSSCRPPLRPRLVEPLLRPEDVQVLLPVDELDAHGEDPELDVHDPVLSFPVHLQIGENVELLPRDLDVVGLDSGFV